MASWKTAHEIEASYLVNEGRLVAYGMRGNLSFRRMGDGEMLFDEAAVARLFRPRGEEGSAAMQGFGVLGGLTLGRAAEAVASPLSTTRLSGRDARTRALRMGREIVEQTQKKATG